MTTPFKPGDHVRWNSEAGYVTGTTIAIHTQDFDYKAHREHASPDDPQYEIRSDRTDHIAAHRGHVLERVAGKDDSWRSRSTRSAIRTARSTRSSRCSTRPTSRCSPISGR
ncbi:DUF2945 domain-containing protein [Burkholderia sp. Bp8994]|nr:DUF2945 domain-containing protein [Burkholderia sp. Bp9131]RQR68858.1 DUF2945 domain-containing protein [Burkholderia sp. Bp9015]RQS01365.1 DUF2945 domain-containing protein [Burkholderia sp. Bp8994]RQS25015.1 DUF2945 domain-containing protein [Burkholderia sp. Bp8995]RQS30663.1 DUF2945 domain-containing protein [Burkholderia sp. Bp8990]RQS43294.1 DUF2945 domain-containing protein [Burkholderia sp. Bp8989]RQS53581.1 DUF2945 domain-containing protein [Burkholderia sp. Bp8984]